MGLSNASSDDGRFKDRNVLLECCKQATRNMIKCDSLISFVA
jgi:hypothetical protein